MICHCPFPLIAFMEALEGEKTSRESLQGSNSIANITRLKILLF